MMYLCVTCGDMVSNDDVDLTADIARCRKCVDEGRTVKWLTHVDSSSFSSLTAHERLYGLSVAYLNSAMCLCRDLGEHPDALDWPRASVVYSCLYHSIELFLKACILIRAPIGEKCAHHDIDKLQDRYCELYPDIKNEFHIESPWDIGLSRAAETFEVSLNIQDFEYQSDQVYRYMTGKDGAPTTAIHVFSPGTCLLMAERFQSDFARIWHKILS